MRKYIEMPDGSALEFEGEVLYDAWDVSTWTANGVLERSARRAINWVEIFEFTPEHWARVKAKEAADLAALSDKEREEKRLTALRRNARRAKTMCRRVIITERFDELLTLTYRENQQDRALCKAHFKEWVRRMKRALGGFRFCASFERQERGAMHVHIATHKLPQHAKYKGVKVKAWQVGTRIWRDIVGADNGMCYVGGATKNGGKRRNLSLAKMAGYVSKYILKDFEDHPEESNRYSRSNGTVVPKPERFTAYGLTDLDAINFVFERSDGQVLHSLKYRPFGSIWLCVEDRPGGVGC